MNGRLKITLLLKIAIAFLISCNSKFDQPGLGSIDTIALATVANGAIEINDSVVANPEEFNVTKFIRSTDSLLSQIQRKDITVTCEVDTLVKDSLWKDLFLVRSFDSSDSIVFTRYSFDPGKGNRELRLWIVVASFADTTSRDKIFAELQRQSGPVNDVYDFVPGLTYNNDFIVAADNRIYWLNTGCSYAYTNHLQIGRLMLSSMEIEKPGDSIQCQCGQPKCGMNSKRNLRKD
jgi:hypothetical protein